MQRVRRNRSYCPDQEVETIRSKKARAEGKVYSYVEDAELRNKNYSKVENAALQISCIFAADL